MRRRDDGRATAHDASIAAWVTVTDPAEAVAAREAGADALIVQGSEAGGHRGGADGPADRKDRGRRKRFG